MKNILLLTDFTRKSDNSHDYTCKLFAGEKCHFTLLSIQKLWQYTMDDLMVATYYGLDEALLGDNRIKVEQQARSLQSKFGKEDFTFEGMIDHDHFTKALKNSAKFNEVDLIVIGSDGVSNLAEAIWSTHSLRVIRNVDCAVLMIPEGYDFQEPKRMQYLMNHKDQFENCNKSLWMDIVEAYQPEIEVLRYSFNKRVSLDKNESALELMRAALPDAVVSYFRQTGDSPQAFIKSHVIGRPAQMQILSADANSFFSKRFNTSRLKSVVDQATVPLLVLRNC